jgi:two-component system, NtrC family, C4-dicarboxylate transport sensor histidine kinase DctB
MGKTGGGRRSLVRRFMLNAARRKKILMRLVVCGLAILILGVAGFIAHKAGQRAAIRVLQAAATHRLDVFRASFFAPIERYTYIPNFLARYPMVIETLRHPDDGGIARLNGFLQDANATAHSSSMYVMNRQGRAIAASNWNRPDSYVGKDFSFRPYFQEAMRNEAGRFFGVGVVTGVPGYYLAYPVTDGDRQLGAIAVKIDLDKVDQHWEGDTEQITVTDDSGIIFLSSNKDWKYRATRPLSDAALVRIRETRQYASMLKPSLDIVPDTGWPGSNVVRVHDRGQGTWTGPYLVQRHELPQAKWTLSIYSDLREVEETAMRYAFVAAGSAAFLILLAMYILQMRRRAFEKDAARKAANAAREKLEQKHRELEVLSRHLKTMSISDPLTGCYNRRYFQEASMKMVSAAQRHRRRISILMLDVDFFKKINDRYGHPAGDEVLKGIALTCQSALREPDFLVRFGGEEFVAVLPDTRIDEARVVAERLRDAIERLTVPVGELALHATISIGLSEFIDTETSLEKAIARADVALYEAKRAGRNRVVAYSPELGSSTATAGNSG